MIYLFGAQAKLSLAYFFRTALVAGTYPFISKDHNHGDQHLVSVLHWIHTHFLLIIIED
jgi:hypothetical protein